MQTKLIFSFIFYSYNVGTRRRIIFSLQIKFFAKIFCIKILFCKHYFSLFNTFMNKGKDPDPERDPDPYLWLMNPDPGGPKTSGFADPDPQQWQNTMRTEGTGTWRFCLMLACSIPLRHSIESSTERVPKKFTSQSENKKMRRLENPSKCDTAKNVRHT